MNGTNLIKLVFCISINGILLKCLYSNKESSKHETKELRFFSLQHFLFQISFLALINRFFKIFSRKNLSTVISNLKVKLESLEVNYFFALVSDIFSRILFHFLKIFYLLSMMMYILSLFSSSFIEEEHQIWYFLEITQLYLIIYNRNNSITTKYFYTTVFLLIITRLTRIINQTGNKWIHLKDVGDILKEFDSKVPLLICGGVSLLVIGYLETNKNNASNVFKKVLLALNLIFIYFYHISTNIELFSL